MYASILRATLMRERQEAITQQARRYAQVTTPAEIAIKQRDAFNRTWRYCLTSVPFYQAWAKEHDLPPLIAHTDEVTQFPALTKAVIIEHADEVFQNGMIKDAYTTGGSTGEPARYPRGAQDIEDNYARTYVGRGFWDLHPFDTYLHIWGHAHLFGGGPLQRLKWQAQDRLVGATRVNAYDMTEHGLKSHYQALLRANPKYIAGYTSAVFKLARSIEESNRPTTRLTNLRGVIVTAETVTQADVDLISKVFGVPVIIEYGEYGTAETGTIATSRGESWPFQVFWQSFILQAGKQDELMITTTHD